MDEVLIEAPHVVQTMEAILSRENYVYESQEMDNMTLLRARFQERYTITFSCMQENSVRSTMRAILGDKIESQRQRSVAATYIAKANFRLNVGQFRIDLTDGEVVFHSTQPLKGMTLGDCIPLLHSWFKAFMATFAVYRHGIKALIEGRSLEAAEGVVDQTLSSIRGGSSSSPSEAPTAKITSSFVTQAMEDIFKGRDYVYEVMQSDSSVTTLKAKFTGGYTVRFMCKPGNNIRSTMLAVLDDKVGDERQRSVVATYFAQVNFSLNNGKFELDMRDGEVMYNCTLPLEGMTQSDCTHLLRSWFSVFMATFYVYMPGLKLIIGGGSIEDANAAKARLLEEERGGGSSRPPAPEPEPVSSSSSSSTTTTTTTTTSSAPVPQPSPMQPSRAAENSVAAKAFKDLLLERGDCSSLESDVEGASHVVQGVYDYKGATAVIWACDKTDEKILEVRVFMVDAVPRHRVEPLSRLIEKVNTNSAVGGFKLDKENGRLYYGYSVPYGGLTDGQLTVLVRGKSLQLCLGTHLEFLPSIKAVIHDSAPVPSSVDMLRSTYHTTRDNPESDFHKNELVPTGRHEGPSAATMPGVNRPRPPPPAYGFGTAPSSRDIKDAAGAMPRVPQLAVEDLDFQDEAGRGGMGFVRKAVYRKGAEVAVKELLPSLAKDDYDLFVREMRVHFSIPSFPHIVPMVGVTQRSKSDRALRLVTDWCNGGSLQTLLNDAFGGDEMEVITYGDALKYARHIAAGVDHLHRHKLLHLDLKPGNVMLDRAGGGGKAKLTDFGLAKIISNGTQTSNRTLGGTFGFMAPEVIEPGKFTKELRSGPHTDVFALGVTVFLLFTGYHRPYKPDVSGHAINQEVCRGLRPEFPAGFSWPGGSRVTERVQNLIQGCWANDPEKRPAVDHILNTLYQIESMVKDANGMDRAISPQTLPIVSSFRM
ncbi:unnamed protein product [Ectocarpus sp. 12 AP-2014]